MIPLYATMSFPCKVKMTRCHPLVHKHCAEQGYPSGQCSASTPPKDVVNGVRYRINEILPLQKGPKYPGISEKRLRVQVSEASSKRSCP